MGNNVTTTPVQTLKIDETNDDIDGNDVSYNRDIANESPYDGIQTEPKPQNDFLVQYPHDEQYYQQFNEQWNHYNQQSMGYPTDQNITENNELINNSVLESSDELTDVLGEMKDNKVLNDLSGDRRTPIARHPILKKMDSIPLLVRSLDGNPDYIKEIDDLESIESGSKLTLNEVKSDTEDVINELTQLSLDLDDKDDKYLTHYRKRGQSWSSWDNSAHLEVETSLSSFSRPVSINDNQTVKTKSYTAPETRGQVDSAIDWLAKQHGLEIGNGVDYENHKPLDRRNSKGLRLSPIEIPGSVSTASTTALNESERNSKYDELDQQIINSIENDFIR